MGLLMHIICYYKPKIVIETMTILPEGQKRSNDFFGINENTVFHLNRQDSLFSATLFAF